MPIRDPSVARVTDGLYRADPACMNVEEGHMPISLKLPPESLATQHLSPLADVLRRSLPKRILRRLARHPVAVVSVVSLVLKGGRETYRWRVGLIDGSEFRVRLGTHFGSTGGGMAGAAAGSAAGTMIAPGLGTMVGAFAGGMAGEMLGGKAGRAALENAEAMLKRNASPSDAPSDNDTPDEKA